MFNNYRIPKNNLLNKTGNISSDGKYTTSLKDPAKRSGASFGALSSARVGITALCGAYLTKSITIAVRYSAVRKQFGPTDDEELPVIEYQVQVSSR